MSCPPTHLALSIPRMHPELLLSAVLRCHVPLSAVAIQEGLDFEQALQDPDLVEIVASQQVWGRSVEHTVCFLGCEKCAGKRADGETARLWG